MKQGYYEGYYVEVGRGKVGGACSDPFAGSILWNWATYLPIGLVACLARTLEEGVHSMSFE